MSNVGQIEKKTQARVVKLFCESLGYEYLGNWIDRTTNRNIETKLLRSFLRKQGYEENLISRALHLFDKAAGDTSKSLFDRNKAVYELLRYGVKVKPEVGENTETVWLIDWKQPLNNHFGIAEEVTVKAADVKAFDKRPDVVLYVNGIALGVLELKRSTVSVTEGIRQNLDNQKAIFIEPFFSTLQLLMAGNDTEGLRYGSIETKEKYYLAWKEDSPIANLLDRQLSQLCNKERLLELIHNFIVYDSGIKKLCRQNQYFGVRAAQEFIKRREGGIIWHTQGSGKSLTMVWLTKWIRENRPDARVLIITDRTELDEQIEKVFTGVNEQIYRTTSGANLIAKLNAPSPWLLCSLIHKFSGKEGDEEVGNISAYLDEVKKSLPPDFVAKGDLTVFVDECHRTQSGELHKAMKALLPNAVFIGFTGTPLLKADKQRIRSTHYTIFIADAGAPFVYGYYSESGNWNGEYMPFTKLKAVSDELFIRDHVNEREGGIKGISYIHGTDILAITCNARPLVFFDLKLILSPFKDKMIKKDSQYNELGRPIQSLLRILNNTKIHHNEFIELILKFRSSFLAA